LNIVEKLTQAGKIRPPDFVANNTHYITLMGSVCYGLATESSDIDIYGFCIPPKELLFPHQLTGEILGFGRQHNRFDQYQQHHIKHDDTKMYDVTIFSIVKYFTLLMENNPNCVDAIFTPANCVLHCTQVGQMVRDNRKLFIHKGLWHKYRGYSYSQLHKASIKQPKTGSKRYEDIKEHGYDCKFLYHVVRLLLEAEQLLQTGDMNLQKDKDFLKAVRRGEWTEEKVRQFFADKEKYLEELYEKSPLPWGPDEEKIKSLLISALEHHYGSLSGIIHVESKLESAMQQIRDICNSTLTQGKVQKSWWDRILKR
jgi:predicted nucleotidyltransferase